MAERLYSLDSGNWMPEYIFAFLGNGTRIDSMATLTIRQLGERTMARLKAQAALHGRSMEEEAREILRSAVNAPPEAKGNLGEMIRSVFAPLGGVELELPPREPIREPPEF